MTTEETQRSDRESVRAAVRDWFNAASIVQYTGPSPESVLREMHHDSRLSHRGITYTDFVAALEDFGIRPYQHVPGHWWMQSAEPQI